MDARGIIEVIDEYISSHRGPVEGHVALVEDEMFEILAGLEEGPWVPYANPYRDDGVFLCVEEVLKPIPGLYSLVGHPRYQQVPQGLCWPVQLPHLMANRLAARLNEEKPREDHQPSPLP